MPVLLPVPFFTEDRHDGHQKNVLSTQFLLPELPISWWTRNLSLVRLQLSKVLLATSLGYLCLMDRILRKPMIILDKNSQAGALC